MWKKELKKSFSDLSQLFDFLEISKKQKSLFLEKSSFPLLLPYRLAQKIKKRSIDDPLLLQFVPSKKEKIEKKGFTLDPLQEKSCCTGRVLRKYPKRALLLASFFCGMHCRFCFRRHFSPPSSSLEEAVEELRKDKTISEVILSGGDPLSLSNQELKKLLQSLEDIPHIERLRIHTRMFIAAPERVDEDFLLLLRELKKPLYFVLHINHPHELGEDLFLSLKKILLLGHPILTQSVLLRRVNDNLQTLTTLFETLINQRILPYYLHKLDPCAGTSHFATTPLIEKKCLLELKNQLPGYGYPKFVQEIAGKKSKQPLVLRNCPRIK